MQSITIHELENPFVFDDAADEYVVRDGLKKPDIRLQACCGTYNSECGTIQGETLNLHNIVDMLGKEEVWMACNEDASDVAMWYQNPKE
jgi:hypothetical protein